MVVVQSGTGFTFSLDGKKILQHSPETPFLFVGVGKPHIAMQKGHFDISDYIVERVALRHAECVVQGAETVVRLSPVPGLAPLVELSFVADGSNARICFKPLDQGINRIWLRVTSEANEHVWGGGEQLSYFDLSRRKFPLWTSEPGNGRDKSTLLTWRADQHNKSGGDYYQTYYPQPTFISSRRYALHIDTLAYSAFDFTREGFHEIEVWEVPNAVEFWSRPHFSDLVTALSDRFGRQPLLPDWVYNGAIMGLKEGEASLTRLDAIMNSGARIGGLWIEDWVGVRQTAFGRRLFWDWKWNRTRYPDLDRQVAALAARGVKVLGYVNPYLCVDGTLFPEAKKRGFLGKRPDSDEVYTVDFGEFDCGFVDFTNPEAKAWFEEDVIGRNMIDFGLSGWMADFGEYLPTDIRLASGETGMTMHNAWPVLWAEVNAKAVEHRGKTGEIIFFMRSGYSGSQRYCPLLWAGDQSVDFTRHDGIGTVICAALSSGLLGNAYHHSDIGGYTSLFDNVRTAELLMRWAEMAAFTPVMRSHEGNRPAQNLQIDQDPEVLAHFGRMTRIYVHLAPYLRSLSQEAFRTGLPVQRPLFLHFEDDPKTYDIQTAYLYGPDLLVAPVIEEGRTNWSTYLPAGANWVHVWSGETHAGGQAVSVAAPFGQPPVFYRAGSEHAALFSALQSLS